MPALILPFYGNETVIEYVKEKENDARLEMVLMCFTFKLMARLTVN